MMLDRSLVAHGDAIFGAFVAAFPDALPGQLLTWDDVKQRREWARGYLRQWHSRTNFDHLEDAEADEMVHDYCEDRLGRTLPGDAEEAATGVTPENVAYFGLDRFARELRGEYAADCGQLVSLNKLRAALEALCSPSSAR